MLDFWHETQKTRKEMEWIEFFRYIRNNNMRSFLYVLSYSRRSIMI